MTNLPKVKPLLAETYLAVIENSVSSKTWQHLYAIINGQKTDIMRNGDLSCAFFVSSILTQFNLIEKIHGTVAGTIFDLEKSGWQKLKKIPTAIKPGSVLVWEAKIGKTGESHKHIGFYLGNDQTVSNSSKTGQIAKHHFTFGSKTGQPMRAIESVWVNKKLK